MVSITKRADATKYADEMVRSLRATIIKRQQDSIAFRIACTLIMFQLLLL
jgi:hypothetical protein